MLRSHLRLALALLAVVATALFFAATPSADAAAIGNDYGPWYAQPGQFGKEQLANYQVDEQIFGSAGVESIGNFTCTYPSIGTIPFDLQGTAISSSDQAILGAVFADATAAYNGNLADSDGTKSDYAITGGEAGMIAFLQQEKIALTQGGWVQFSTHSSAAPGQSQGTGEVNPTLLYQQYQKDIQQVNSNGSQVATAQRDLPTQESALTKYATEARSLIATIKALSGKYPDLGNFQLQDGSGTALSYSQADSEARALPTVFATGANHKSAGYSVLQSDLGTQAGGWNNISKYEAKVSALISSDQQTIANGTSSYTKAQLAAGLGAPPLPALAALIDINPAQTNVPLNLAYLVPEGCGLNPIDAQGVDFIQIITAPGTFFTDLLLYIPQHAAQESYNFLQPKAFLYTFWTPHTERGDTIFNVATSCPPQTGNESAATLQIQQNSCSSSNQPLGFNQKNLQAQNLQQHMPWYLSVAIFLQWLISGFYFVILFAAALLHMTRGDKRTQLSVLTLVPKLMISVLLTIFAPTIMGGLIDFSNTFVSSIFTLDSARSVGRITDILAQSNTYLTGAGTLVTQLVQVIVGLFTDFFFAFFILGSLIRQLVLMALVMLAPLACFCILVPRWQPQFTRYVRVLLACIFLPAVMAFILKLGISLNPIVSAAANNSSVDGITGLIGLFMVMITLWLMAKAMKLTAAIATGNSAFTNSLTGRTMGKLGAAASMAGAAGVFGMGTASRALGAGAALGAASEGIGASLIPSGKSLAGGGSGGGLLGGGRRLGLPGAGGSSFGSEGDPSGGGRGLAARYEARLNQRMEGRGEQRIPQAQAQAYQKELAGAIAARESASGHRLSRGERDELMHGQLIRDDAGNIIVDRATGKTQRADGGFVGAHGALVERKGNSYLTKPETAAPKRVPGRIGQAVGAVTDVVQVPLAAVRAAGSTPVGGGVGRAGDRAIGAARVAATAARAGTTKVASGDIASLHSDQALAHSEDAAAASAALTANWGRREQTHALAGSVDEAAANPRAVARQARAAAPVPASPPPKPRRRARASVSSPLNDTKASKEDAPKLVP